MVINLTPPRKVYVKNETYKKMLVTFLCTCFLRVFFKLQPFVKVMEGRSWKADRDDFRVSENLRIANFFRFVRHLKWKYMINVIAYARAIIISDIYHLDTSWNSRKYKVFLFFLFQPTIVRPDINCWDFFFGPRKSWWLIEEMTLFRWKKKIGSKGCWRTCRIKCSPFIISSSKIYLHDSRFLSFSTPELF